VLVEGEKACRMIAGRLPYSGIVDQAQWGEPVRELDDSLTPTLARQFEAEQALLNGDPEPRLALTSAQDPVTVFGAKVPVRPRSGWE
jgi:hypothetical protein